MRIVESSVGVIRSVLPRSVGNAHTQWHERAGLLLVLRDEEGRVGLGEASPLPGYSADSLEECEASLRGLPDEFDKMLTGRPPAAQFALETAWLDLQGQRSGRPISELLTEQPRRTVARSGLLDADPRMWIQTARELIARGIRTSKVKVGRAGVSGQQECDDLLALREAIGPCTLRLDANGAWTPDEARVRLELFARVAPEFVEQPVPPGELPTLGRTQVPWAADESLRDPAVAMRLLEASCSAFVLKPAVLGGLRASMALAQRGHSRGIPSVASHLFDGPVALAACAELALALPGRPLACGVDTHAALVAWPDISIPQFRVPGELVASGLAGLGFSDDARREIASWIP